MLHLKVPETLKLSLVALAPIILTFRILTFRNSCDEESHHLNLPTTGINGSNPR
jgi:hypothetical protein